MLNRKKSASVFETDLLLINTPLYDCANHKRAYSANDLLPPLGLGYIATEAKNRGFNVQLIDAEAKGISVAKTIKTIHQINPKFVGFNALTPTMGILDKIIDGLSSSLPIILGGAHASALPKHTLKRYAYKKNEIIVVRGEAELVISQILEGTDKNELPGVYWLENGEIKINKTLAKLATSYLDLNKAPLLDRNFFINEPSIDTNTGLKEGRILTTRGCPYACKFCAGAIDALGQPLRARSNSNIIKEIKFIVQKHGIKSIRVVDDLFIRDEKQINDFMDLLDEEKIDIKFDVTGRANILYKFSNDLWDRLSLRFNEISMGVEHGVKKIRHSAKKYIIDKHIFHTLDQGTKRNIKFKLYGIIGLPGTTYEDERQNIHYFKNTVEKYHGLVRASLFCYRPFPGTQYWHDLLAKGWTEKDMLQMSGDRPLKDKRSRKMVITSASFCELAVEELSEMLIEFNKWQDDLFSLKANA
jgi:anaerobic magnesium-protoporphyrin IX monomethyl ester cyclase